MKNFALLLFIILFNSLAWGQLKKQDLSGKTLGSESPTNKPQISQKQLQQLKKQLSALIGDSTSGNKANQLLQSLDMNKAPSEAQMQLLLEVLKDSKSNIQKRNKVLNDFINE